METCMMKPGVKKRPVKPTPPPKPAHLKTRDPEGLEPAPLRPSHALKTIDPEGLEQPAPLRPSHAFVATGSELSATSGSLSEHKDATCLNSDESGGNDGVWENSNEKGGFFRALLKKSNKILRGGTNKQVVLASQNSDLSVSSDSLNDSSKLAKESLSTHSELSKSDENVNDSNNTKDTELLQTQTSDSNDNVLENNNDVKSTDPLHSELSDSLSEDKKSEDMEELIKCELGHQRTIKRKRRVVSFRIKKTFPQIPKITSSSRPSDKLPIIEENDKTHNPNPAEDSTVDVQPVQMVDYLTGNDPPESEQSDELMEWWNTAAGWTEWNETADIQQQDQEMIVEEAADRVFLAARLFVHLFNQRGASLQQRILGLLSLADDADQFHKKTVAAAVGGGAASVVGSVATITGLILAPFTFGASIIVTAVGISVATAGGITSATANITDTVHSTMDRKKVEKMIQGYQEEIKDIRECLEFVQEGMDTLQEWDFEQYSQSAAKKALNHNIKHVVKEGGRAGKDLMINTSTLISTVQILGATGGAVKAAQVVSVTTGVMSALFLALDVFFLAKDSHELRKGAKTKFAAKIREVCKELQQGLLELNKVKTQLQKTMDGIEVEEYEEIQEVEVEIEDDYFESDPKKLAELEQELDLLEEKLDKKVEEEQKKSEKETESLKSKWKIEKGTKENGDSEIKEVESTRKKNANKTKKGSEKENDETEAKLNPELDELHKETEKSVKVAKDDFKEQSQEGSKVEKIIKNTIEKWVNKPNKAKKNSGTHNKAVEEKTVDVEETSRLEDSIKEDRTEEMDSESLNTDKESNQRTRQETRVTTPEWKPLNTEMESVGMKTRGSRSKRQIRGSDEERDNHSIVERAARRESNSREVEKLTEIKDRSETKREGGMNRDQGRRDLNKRSHPSHKRASRGEVLERGRSRSQEELDINPMEAQPHDQNQRDEERGKRVENMRRKFEREGSEEVNKEKRREDGKRWRTDRESHHSRQRRLLSAELTDGLYI